MRPKANSGSGAEPDIRAASVDLLEYMSRRAVTELVELLRCGNSHSDQSLAEAVASAQKRRGRRIEIERSTLDKIIAVLPPRPSSVRHVRSTLIDIRADVERREAETPEPALWLMRNPAVIRRSRLRARRGSGTFET